MICMPHSVSRSRPHVLMLNRWFEPEVTGGTETSLSGLSDALADLGVSISVICETRHLAAGTSMVRGHEVRRYAVAAPPKRFWFAAASSNYAHIVRNLRRIAPSVPHDFIIARMPEFAAAAAAVLPTARIVYWSPGNNPYWFGMFQGRSDLGPRERLWSHVDAMQNSVIYKRATRGAHVIVAETETVKADIIRRNGVPASKVVVRRNGVDLKKFRPGPGDARLAEMLGLTTGAPLVVGVGRLEPMKNFGFLLRGFAAMRSRSAKLVLIGEGSERANLERQAAALGVADRVTFAGWRADVEKFLAMAHAFVLPSVYEPYGNAFTEALAAGVPSIGLRNGPSVSAAAVDHISDGVNGFLVDFEDVQALADRLDLIAGDTNRRVSLAAAARRLAVDRYDWKSVAIGFLEDLNLAGQLRADGAIAAMSA